MFTRLLRRLAALIGRDTMNRDLEEEMRLHVELRAQRLRGQGLSEQEAYTAARRRFGNARRLREDAVGAHGWLWLEQAAQDVRFGVRTLVRNPAFAATAVLTLSVATGATTAIFSVLDAVVLKPLPFPEPDQLVQVYGRSWREDRGGEPDPLIGPVAYSDLDAYRAQSGSFQGFAAYQVGVRHLDAGNGTLDRLQAVVADLELFTVLGVEPLLGRTFQPGDPPGVAVISARVWRERFDANPSVLNTAIRLENRSVNIIGVMPERFQFPYRAASLLRAALPESRTDVWIPLDPPGRGRLSVVGRMKPGVTVEAGLAELRVIAARLEQQYAGTRIRVGVRTQKLSEVVIAPVRRSLWMLFAAVSLVLAAACANVANLLLARMSVRTREVVTRAALGAGRARLARQFLAESLCLGLAGGLGGIVIARWGTAVLARAAHSRIPRAHEISLDWQAFAFLLAACVVTAIIFGLAPAVMAARIDAQAIARESGGHATMGRKFAYLRDALVIAEVTLAFVLACGASVVIRELVRLRHVDTGMATERVVVLSVTPRVTAADCQAIEDRVAQLPGVRAAGFIQMVPLQNWGWEADFNIRGRPPAPGVRRTTDLRYVTPGYFPAMGIPILRGRGFEAADTADAPRVVVINDALARRYFPGEDPVGQVLDRGTIVGVAGDVRNVRLDQPAIPELYYPAAQNIATTSELGMSLVAYADGPPEAIVPSLRAAVRAVRPGLAIFNVRTMEQIVDNSLADLNLYRWLIGSFAAVALVLSALGLYGVISYMTAARTREFAIRLALGSRAAALAGGVMGRSVALAAAGVASGALATFLMSGLLRRLPIGGAPDAAVYALIVFVLLAIAVAAAALPAWRAAAVDPAAALRHE